LLLNYGLDIRGYKQVTGVGINFKSIQRNGKYASRVTFHNRRINYDEAFSLRGASPIAIICRLTDISKIKVTLWELLLDPQTGENPSKFG